MPPDPIDLTQLHEQLIQAQQQVIELEQKNKLLTQELTHSNEMLNATLDGTGLCLWEQDIPSGNLVMFNQEWGKLLGYSLAEVPAHIESWKSNLHLEDKDWVIKAFYDHVEGKEDMYRAVHRMYHSDGSIRWVSDRGRIIEYTDQGEPKRIVGTHIDITQEKRYEMELSRLAHVDPLTNLLNRNAIKSNYQQHFTSANIGGSIAFIDLDGFKAINDYAGHHMGDKLLAYVANAITHSVHKTFGSGQHFIARVGGDEFLILTTVVDRALLQQCTTILLTQFSQQICIESHDFKIGLSIGIYQFSQPTSFSKICDKADKAMYFIKQNGKHGTKFYDHDM